MPRMFHTIKDDELIFPVRDWTEYKPLEFQKRNRLKTLLPQNETNSNGFNSTLFRYYATVNISPLLLYSLTKLVRNNKIIRKWIFCIKITQNANYYKKC